MTTSALTLDPSQERAVDLMCTAPIGVVTGGPGTGKSTCSRVALDRLDAAGQRYMLAAPTGKAARRLHETTGREAGTIHRLLEFSPRAGGFQRNRHNPIAADAVLIDEASMIDVELAGALFDAIGPRTRLILIGDADQLPPVGPGRVFGDLVEHGTVPIARLTTLHRSALESWIHVNAQRVLRGEMIDLAAGRKDFRFYEVEDAAKIVPLISELTTRIIPQEIDAPSQILIPQRPGLAGIEAANAALQQAVNPKRADRPALARGKAQLELRLGDRVIQTKNDYKLGESGVFNGEIGDVTDIEKGKVVVTFPDRGDITYSLEQTKALQHAYALTVHRFQGSEVPWAVVVCHSTHSYILTRQLIYTAITRGKQGVILVGNKKGIQTALSDKKPPVRNTALIERLRGELEGNAA